MEGPFIPRKSYMYGNTFFEQEVPQYNSTRHHREYRKPRGLVKQKVFDDGTEYKPDSVNSNGNIVRGCVPNIINVETMLVKSLKVYLYGVREEDDHSYTLDIGKRYAITYITEQGMRVADGYLRFLSSSIPEDCTKYVGDYTSTAAQAFIGIDCSAKGVSDKRKIYISTIRGIKPLDDDEDYVAPAENEEAKKFSIVERLEEILNELEANGCDCCTEVAEKVDLIGLKMDELQNGSIYAGDLIVGEVEKKE